MVIPVKDVDKVVSELIEQFPDDGDGCRPAWQVPFLKPVVNSNGLIVVER